MSDSDDDERAAAGFASVFALAAMQDEAGGASPSKCFAKEKKKIVSPDDYKPPTQEDLEWNEEVEKQKLVEKTAAFKNGKQLVGRALVGKMDKEMARDLCKTSLQHMDLDKGGAKITSTGGKKQYVTQMPGVSNYDLHVGVHDARAQMRSTVLINAGMLQNNSQDLWPELHAFYEAAQKLAGNKFRPVVSHILFGQSTQVAFEYHWDVDQHKKEVHLTFLAELGNSCSTMHIAGDEEITYEQPGSWKMFDAQLVHRSGAIYADTIKIVIFFEEIDEAGKAISKKPKKAKSKKFNLPVKAGEETKEEEAKEEVKKEEAVKEEEEVKKEEEEKTEEGKEEEGKNEEEVKEEENKAAETTAPDETTADEKAVEEKTADEKKVADEKKADQSGREAMDTVASESSPSDEDEEGPEVLEAEDPEGEEMEEEVVAEHAKGVPPEETAEEKAGVTEVGDLVDKAAVEV